MSVALVAILVVPMRIADEPVGGASATPALDRNAPSLTERRVEAEYIANTRQGTLSVTESVVRPAGTFPRTYPDGIRPARKEVSPANPSGRPMEAV
jgi:hypothetical protein